ncbi:ROK family transcriptional regulator [Microbacterium sp. X-17]|uniref:ROK family transcriptional regulator n=1 Tax=Microbacterium sp. X-17 TaxID=3144404 RepID=UPI0031F51FC4
MTEITDDHKRVLRLIHEQGTVSRAAVSAETGWARATVTQRLNELIAAGWVVEMFPSGAAEGRGRPSTSYQLNLDGPLIFVLSFGQSQVLTALTDLDRNPVVTRLVAFEREHSTEQAQQVSDGASDYLDALLDSLGRDRSDVKMVVIGKPGPVDLANPLVDASAMPGWISVGVRDEVEAALGIPTLLENDANLMVIGSWESAGRPNGSYVFVKIARGIGAGILIDGKLVRGRMGLAGEIGHNPVSANHGEPCSCGQRTCVTQYASADAIVRNVAALGLPVENIEGVATLAMEGNPLVTAELRQAGRFIGEALLGLVTTLAPEVIVLGGRASQLGDHLVAGTRESIYSRSVPAISTGLNVVAASNHRVLSLRGASSVGVSALIDRGTALKRDEAAIRNAVA